MDERWLFFQKKTQLGWDALCTQKGLHNGITFKVVHESVYLKQYKDTDSLLINDMCMYVCMHVCIYAWMYVCMYVCMYACMYVCMYVCARACVCEVHYHRNMFFSCWTIHRGTSQLNADMPITFIERRENNCFMSVGWLSLAVAVSRIRNKASTCWLNTPIIPGIEETKNGSVSVSRTSGVQRIDITPPFRRMWWKAGLSRLLWRFHSLPVVVNNDLPVPRMSSWWGRQVNSKHWLNLGDAPMTTLPAALFAYPPILNFERVFLGDEDLFDDLGVGNDYKNFERTHPHAKHRACMAHGTRRGYMNHCVKVNVGE